MLNFMLPQSLIMLFTTFLTLPLVVSATTFEFYRSALCDKQDISFHHGRYNTLSLYTDTTCHTTPAQTIAMRLRGGIDEDCFVLAYGDQSCSHGTLVGVVPSTGSCLASTKMRMGSWEAVCRYGEDNSSTVSYRPGELKGTPGRAVAFRDIVWRVYDWVSCAALRMASASSRLRTSMRQWTMIRQTSLVTKQRPITCVTEAALLARSASPFDMVRVNGVDRNSANAAWPVDAILTLGAVHVLTDMIFS